ncbi:MAG: putative protease YdcP [Chlamydiae bacterium]|nr:putative protease YdcP [Chlamydiota bacterium]
MKETNPNKIQVLAPAGSFETLQAAIQGGADSVYFGVGDLNMRSRAANHFTIGDLDEVVKRCEEHGVKTHVTLNSVMYDRDLPQVQEICDALKKSGVHAVIAHDIAVIMYAQSIEIPTHISTQVNVCNFQAVKYYAQYADVIVLARELNLEQIRSICDNIQKEHICGPGGELVKIEVFVHGALCVAISGKCYMSLAQQNASANRGECQQMCRRKYRVTDEDTGKELVLDNQYIMSPKDLCTIEYLDQMIDAGASVLKIEGRGKAPEYVYAVTKAYREAVDSIGEGTYSKEKIEKWKSGLEKVYNRGFWHGGYYLGNPLGEWSGTYGSKATRKKEYIGKTTNYFAKSGVGEFLFEAGTVESGDQVMVVGPTTGVLEFTISSMREHIEGSDKRIFTIPTPEKVRRNDKLYLFKNRV